MLTLQYTQATPALAGPKVVAELASTSALCSQLIVSLATMPLNCRCKQEWLSAGKHQENLERHQGVDSCEAVTPQLGLLARHHGSVYAPCHSRSPSHGTPGPHPTSSSCASLLDPSHALSTGPSPGMQGQPGMASPCCDPLQLQIGMKDQGMMSGLGILVAGGPC